MKLNELMNFAKGKEPAEQTLSCVVTRNGNDIEITRCTLTDNIGKDLVFECVTTKDDIEFFKNPDVKAMIKKRIKVCRQKLLKFDINTITVDEQELDM